MLNHRKAPILFSAVKVLKKTPLGIYRPRALQRQYITYHVNSAVSGLRTMALHRHFSTGLPSLYILHYILKSYSLSRPKRKFIFFYNKAGKTPIASYILDVTKLKKK